MRTNRLSLRPELQRAIDAVEACLPKEAANPPERDWRLIAFKQLEQLHQAHLKEIENMEAYVRSVKLSAKAALVELMVRREILEDQLGVERPEEPTRGGD